MWLEQHHFHIDPSLTSYYYTLITTYYITFMKSVIKIFLSPNLLLKVIECRLRVIRLYVEMSLAHRPKTCHLYIESKPNRKISKNNNNKNQSNSKQLTIFKPNLSIWPNALLVNLIPLLSGINMHLLCSPIWERTTFPWNPQIPSKCLVRFVTRGIYLILCGWFEIFKAIVFLKCHNSLV